MTLPAPPPRGCLRLAECHADTPFSPAMAARSLGLSVRSARVALSRWTRSGWLLRAERGRYVTADLVVRSMPEIERALRPFSSRCFLPVLHRAVGEVLRVYSGRVRAIALFGSTATGTDHPLSDIDLLVVADRLPANPRDRVLETISVQRAVDRLVVSEWKRHRHFHSVGLVPLPTSTLDRPGPLFLDLPRQARILYDPERRLSASLARLGRALKGRGARPRVTRDGHPYWDLGAPLEELLA